MIFNQPSTKKTVMSRFAGAAMFLSAISASSLCAQELPVVDGLALLLADNPENCFGDPLTAIMEQIANSDRDLRTVTMVWSELSGIADAEVRGDFSFSEGTPDLDSAETESQRPTVHLFPDRTIYVEPASCEDPELTGQSAGRIWAIGVSGALSSPSLALPDDWSEYVSDRSAAGGSTATCLLLGGALQRQPALATIISRNFVRRVSDDLPSEANLHEARLADGLFNPAARRLLGWDVAFLAGPAPDAAEELSACAHLMDMLLDGFDETPTLGADPLATRENCLDTEFASGEMLRSQIQFRSNSSELAEEAHSVIASWASCAAQVRSQGLEVSMTIEAYASTIGISSVNWTLSNRRAETVRQATIGALELAGFDLEEGVVGGIEITSGGFGGSRIIGADGAGNRTALLTLSLPLERRHVGSADSALANRYLSQSGTCGVPSIGARSRTLEFIPFLASPFGTRLREAVSDPNFLMVFHNDPDTVGFARSLEVAAASSDACAGPGANTHVGFLYRREGPPFWQDPSTEQGVSPVNGNVTDYFVLPPRIYWIYTTDPSADFTALERLAELYRIESQNFDDLTEISTLGRAALQARLGRPDVLTVRSPTPVSEILAALEAVNVGTGWVHLTGGWD